MQNGNIQEHLHVKMSGFCANWLGEYLLLRGGWVERDCSLLETIGGWERSTKFKSRFILKLKY